MLFGIQTGPLYLLADGAEVSVAAAYLAAVARVRRRARAAASGGTVRPRLWPATRTGLFLVGVVLVWAAVGSGLSAYDEVNVTAHVVQHVLLMMVAAPLLALGMPLTLAAQALPRAGQLRLVHAFNGPRARFVSHQAVASCTYYATMFGYFLTPLYRYSVYHEQFHAATHLIFLLSGYLYWQMLLGGGPKTVRLSYPVRVVIVLGSQLIEGVLGVLLLAMPRPISPLNTLAGTHEAGQAFIVLSMLVSASWTAYLVAAWLRSDERATPREDRRAEAAWRESSSRAQKLGVKGVPDGWRVAEWYLDRLDAERDGAKSP